MLHVLKKRLAVGGPADLSEALSVPRTPTPDLDVPTPGPSSSGSPDTPRSTLSDFLPSREVSAERSRKSVSFSSSEPDVREIPHRCDSYLYYLSLFQGDEAALSEFGLQNHEALLPLLSRSLEVKILSLGGSGSLRFEAFEDLIQPFLALKTTVAGPAAKALDGVVAHCYLYAGIHSDFNDYFVAGYRAFGLETCGKAQINLVQGAVGKRTDVKQLRELIHLCYGFTLKAFALLEGDFSSREGKFAMSVFVYNLLSTSKRLMVHHTLSKKGQKHINPVDVFENVMIGKNVLDSLNAEDPLRKLCGPFIVKGLSTFVLDDYYEVDDPFDGKKTAWFAKTVTLERLCEVCGV